MPSKPSEPPAPEGAVLPQSTDLLRTAYERGVSDTLALLVRKLGPWKARRVLGGADAPIETAAMVEVLRRGAELQTPAMKAARTKQLRRQFKDEGQAIEFAALVRGGNTTEQARAKMGIGLIKAKRLRKIGVKLQLIRPRQMKPGT